MVDPNDWLPLLGVGLLIATTGFAIAGAWAVGRARGMRDVTRLRDDELSAQQRLEAMQRTLESVAEEVERLGEVQRFALKVIAEKAALPADTPKLQPGRVITPH